ncbi:MAG TPA: hypothetical protein VIK53_11640 [Verrucomicrobiae bacterium]
MMLAQSVVEIPMNDTMKTVVGLLGVMSLGIGVMWFAVLWRKLFGRKPPLAAELDKMEKKLHDEIIESFGRSYKNSDEARLAVSALRGEVVEAFRDHRAEFNGRIEKLDEKLGRVSGDVIADLANALTIASQTSKKS